MGLGSVMGLVERGAEFGAQYARMLGQGMQVLPGAAHEYALKPIGQGIAWTADTFAPVLTPVGRGIRAAMLQPEPTALRPLANGTAMTVDEIARAPAAIANHALLRNRRRNAPTGDDLV
ncbi:hypothetical protein HR51_41040 [Burkholderia cepacia]|nr:hypothetical protein HR51_41040 [Burkholderia cepacia]